MAMPSGNVAPSDKMQYPMGGPGPAQWFPDERDGFIAWLRQEFAAANAVIDALCAHLRAVGGPGEYDAAINSIQQRRFNWTPVLHLQQYFSIADVLSSLNQAAWRRQRFGDAPRIGNREFRRLAGTGFRPGYNGNSSSGYVVANGNGGKLVDEAVKGSEDSKKDFVGKAKEDGGLKSPGSSEEAVSEVSDAEVAGEDGKCMSSSKEVDSRTMPNQGDGPKTFIASEMCDGKQMNVVEGLKLYEDFSSDTELSKLSALANDLRSAGKRGQFQGDRTFTISKRPMKGHGREMIQLGLPIAEAPAEEDISKDRRIEAIPPLLQEVAERLVSTHVTSEKPDSCIIDFYNEGDHSQPHMFPYWFGRPVCVLLLTECDVTFGNVFTIDRPGNFRGALQLSLKPGSLLAMQGKSADFSKFALPTIRKQRILITFTKSQPRRSVPGGAPSTHWGPPPSRSPNHHIRHPGPKHYAPVPTTGVLPPPPSRPNGIHQPIFLPAAAPPAIPFTVPARHPAPRPPIPGTGVFLPPQGSNGNMPASLPNADALPGKENGKQECNGSTDGPRDGTSAAKEDLHGSSNDTSNG